MSEKVHVSEKLEELARAEKEEKAKQQEEVRSKETEAPSAPNPSLMARFRGANRPRPPGTPKEKPAPAASAPVGRTLSKAQAKREASARRRGKGNYGGTHMVKHSKRS